MNNLLSSTVNTNVEIFAIIGGMFAMISAATIILLNIIGLFQKGNKHKVKKMIIGVLFATVLVLLGLSAIFYDKEMKDSLGSLYKDLPKWLGLLYIAIEVFVVGVYAIIESKSSKDE